MDLFWLRHTCTLHSQSHCHCQNAENVLVRDFKIEKFLRRERQICELKLLSDINWHNVLVLLNLLSSKGHLLSN